MSQKVFQLFRELGNTVAFLKDLSDYMDTSDIFKLIQVWLSVRSDLMCYDQI